MSEAVSEREEAVPLDKVDGLRHALDDIQRVTMPRNRQAPELRHLTDASGRCMPECGDEIIDAILGPVGTHARPPWRK